MHKWLFCLIFVFPFGNLKSANAQSLSLSLGGIFSHLINANGLGGCLGCAYQHEVISDLHKAFNTSPVVSLGYENKFCNWLGFSGGIGVIQYNTPFSYHADFYDLEDFDNHTSTNYQEDYSSSFDLTDIYARLTFDVFPLVDKRYYLFFGLLPEVVYRNKSSETYQGKFERINYLTDSTTNGDYSGNDVLYNDHSDDIEVTGGVGIILGRSSKSPIFMEIEGFQGFTRYNDEDPPVFKRNGLELKVGYKFLRW